MSLITRQFGPNAKGSRLTFQEMDDNLLYLESLGDGIAYYGQMSIQTGTTVSVATASTYQSLGFSGTLDSQVFGLTAAGDFGLKNISGNTILVEVFGSVDLDNGNNKEYGIKLAKNGVVIDETECRAESGNSHSLVKLVTNWMIELDDQDEVEIYFTNFTSTGNLVIERAKIVATTVGKTDAVGTGGTQSFILGFPLFDDLTDYALNIIGTYSDFTYPKVTALNSIAKSDNLNIGTVSNYIGATLSSYSGLLSIDISGGTDPRDVLTSNITVVEGPVPADNVAYQYFFYANIYGFEYNYEFFEMSTHSNIRYAHYFNTTNIAGRAGGSIELDFDGVTVTTDYGSNSLFTTNVP